MEVSDSRDSTPGKKSKADRPFDILAMIFHDHVDEVVNRSCRHSKHPWKCSTSNKLTVFISHEDLAVEYFVVSKNIV